MQRISLILALLFIVLLFGIQTKDYSVARASIPYSSMKPASLCAKNENVVWSCETVRDRKLASVCSSKVLEETRGYVQYRFGRVGQIELEFPRERVNTQAAFKYSRYTRYMVTYLKLEFVSGGFTYTISDDSNYEEKPGRRDADITVTPMSANAKETRLRCRLPVAGSLMKLEDVVPKTDYN
jgi:hypothetical protein